MLLSDEHHIIGEDLLKNITQGVLFNIKDLKTVFQH